MSRYLCFVGGVNSGNRIYKDTTMGYEGIIPGEMLIDAPNYSLFYVIKNDILSIFNGSTFLVSINKNRVCGGIHPLYNDSQIIQHLQLMTIRPKQ